jgi:ribosomal protein S18 acetylase RimI-like enzyme
VSARATGVRRAEARDLDALAELFAVLLAHHEALEPAFRVRAGARERLPKLLARQLGDPDAAVFVWEDATGVLGFCSARVERTPEAVLEVSRVAIDDLAVRSDRRRRGVGRALADAACAWARSRGAERLEVRVAARNPEGQAFWRALGYEGFVDILQRRL